MPSDTAAKSTAAISTAAKSQRAGGDLESLARRIERLQLDYVHRIDDDAIESMPEMFTDKCLYRITSRENWLDGSDLGVIRCESPGMLRDRVTAMRHAAMFAPRTIRHILSGTLVDRVDGADIHARTNVAIYQTSADGDTLLLMAAIYRDIVTETPDGLRFREKHLVYDTLRLPDSVICPL
jgi:anthranilate 1,2-dioxygenase small subunit